MNKIYICVAPDKEMFSISGKSLGMQGERALYYSSDIGKHRIYRQSYPLQPLYFNEVDINKNLELFTFETKEEAQEFCDAVNEVHGDDFQVVEKEVE